MVADNFAIPVKIEDGWRFLVVDKKTAADDNARFYLILPVNGSRRRNGLWLMTGTEDTGEDVRVIEFDRVLHGASFF
jgi:hypothetical protein